MERKGKEKNDQELYIRVRAVQKRRKKVEKSIVPPPELRRNQRTAKNRERKSIQKKKKEDTDSERESNEIIKKDKVSDFKLYLGGFTDGRQK